MDKFTISEELSVFIGSWNVGGAHLKDNIDLSAWLHPKGKGSVNQNSNKTPDIYCIGLQEIVELNANYLLISSNSSKVEFWRNAIKNTLDTVDK
jgi:hypothetical protein